MIIRLSSFIVVVLIGLYFPIWFFAPIALVYALVFQPTELLLIGVYIDATFGNPEVGVWYWYTLMSIGFLILARGVKPYLSAYK